MAFWLCHAMSSSALYCILQLGGATGALLMGLPGLLWQSSGAGQFAARVAVVPLVAGSTVPLCRAAVPC